MEVGWIPVPYQCRMQVHPRTQPPSSSYNQHSCFVETTLSSTDVRSLGHLRTTGKQRSATEKRTHNNGNGQPCDLLSLYTQGARVECLSCNIIGRFPRDLIRNTYYTISIDEKCITVCTTLPASVSILTNRDARNFSRLRKHESLANHLLKEKDELSKRRMPGPA